MPAIVNLVVAVMPMAALMVTVVDAVILVVCSIVPMFGSIMFLNRMFIDVVRPALYSYP